MKAFLSGLLAAIAAAFGIFTLFFRKPSAKPTFNTTALDNQAEALKSDIDKLSKERDNLKVEDKSLEDEIKYWEEQNKGKLQ